MQIQVDVLGWPPSKNNGHQYDFTCFRIGDSELNLTLSHFFTGNEDHSMNVPLLAEFQYISHDLKKS